MGKAKELKKFEEPTQEEKPQSVPGTPTVVIPREVPQIGEKPTESLVRIPQQKLNTPTNQTPARLSREATEKQRTIASSPFYFCSH